MLCRLEDAIFIFYNLVTTPRIRQVDTKTLTRRNIMLYIGVDLGTSAVKLLLMDEKGDIKKLFQKNTHYTSHIRAGQNNIRKTGLPSP